jgi:hypothetical protein
MNNDDPVNRAIDRVVREMIAVEAPPDVRARVMARVARAESSGWKWQWAPAAIAAACLIVATVLMWPHSDSSPQNPASGSVTTSTDPPRRERLPSVAQTPRQLAARPDNATVSHSEPISIPPEMIPALEEIPPLVITAPEAPRIEPEAITVPPVTAIPAVHVEPPPFASQGH